MNLEFWIASYGYAAIFVLLLLGIVGLPVPDETMLIICGYLIFKGTLRPIPAFLTALCGSWCGISLSYTIGRVLGAGAVSRYGRHLHLTEDRLAKVHRWFDRVGHWALAFGYFIVGVRHVTAIVAGMSKLQFRSFALYAWSGGAVWVLSFILLGYTFGEQWRSIEELVRRDMVYASLGLLAAAALALIARQILRRRRLASAQVPGPSRN
jgi:membrane protein DedA with SNARE-associated domain